MTILAELLSDGKGNNAILELQKHFTSVNKMLLSLPIREIYPDEYPRIEERLSWAKEVIDKLTSLHSQAESSDIQNEMRKLVIELTVKVLTFTSLAPSSC